MTAPTCIDLFSGAAGAWTLGLHRAGFRTVAACEFEDRRRAAYATNWPEVRLYDDVQTLTADRLSRDGIARPLLVCGSPPCQDASPASARARVGIAGERTGLFREFVRIVLELRPRWVAAENHPDLMGCGGDWVCDRLGEEGYRVWPHVVAAEDVGCPVERERLFILARSEHAGTEEEPFWTAGQSWGSAHLGADDEGQSRLPFDAKAMARRARLLRGDRGGSQARWLGDWVGALGRHLRVVSRVPSRVAGEVAEAYGDTFPPLIAEGLGRAILETEASLSPST